MLPIKLFILNEDQILLAISLHICVDFMNIRTNFFLIVSSFLSKTLLFYLKLTYFLVMSFLPFTNVVEVDVRFMLLLPGALLNDIDEIDVNPLFAGA